MDYTDTLLGLLPPVSYARNALKIRNQARIDARVLNNIADSATQVLNAMDPRTAGDALPDWERLLGLNGSGQSYPQRRAAVLAKINATGGLSIPYFIRLAEAAGYRIRIEEPQPFRAGQNRAGDRIAPEDIIWTWRVHVQGSSQRIWLFRAGAGTAGGRLSEYADDVIESIFEDLKPAHTWVGFTYGAEHARD
ncbi:YmfQ family protein [Neisseria leonii]|uniref:YmfQ family protein n=1 Tax=Neisseria leonii TaxID=2995413 RepID=UPI00237BA343|nr:YmfQ family protein [Neisseria sp. 3986]MDD9325604.1 YmfQ family protein [Neisseria sp. 3986]